MANKCTGDMFGHEDSIKAFNSKLLGHRNSIESEKIQTKFRLATAVTDCLVIEAKV